MDISCVARSHFRAALCLVMLTNLHSDCLAEEPNVDTLLTVAEASDFEATATSEQVSELLAKLAERGPHVRRFSFGKTIEQRPLECLIAARPPVNEPSQLADDTRLVVLLLGGIHAGERAGKEALLMLARELALDAKHPLLDNLVILIAPNYNADANERVGALHRPNQIGPKRGMGVRKNVQQLDLNRDFTKLAAPETRALVRLIDRWDPHLFIDTHTTNGSHHRYVLTYDTPHNPAVDGRLQALLRDELLPQVTQRLREAKMETFYYGNFDKEKKRWSTFGYEPRYSTEYVGLRGRLAILSEAYSYASYRRRVEASREFVRQCLNAAAERREKIRKTLDDVRNDAPREIPLQAKLAAFPDKVAIQGYKSVNDNYIQGDGSPPQDYEVEFFGRFETTAKIKRPKGYFLAADESRVADRLLMHGVRLLRLTEPGCHKVTSLRVKSVKRGATVDGQRLRSVSVQEKTEDRQFAKGDFYIPTDQPLGRLAVWLLEPDSVDGFTAWGFMNQHLVAGRTLPVVRVNAEVPPRTEPVEHIEPAQRLSLQKIFGPERRAPFGGSFPLNLRWDIKEASYSRRLDGANFWIDAETGARQATADRTTAIRKGFAALAAIDAKDAARMAQSVREQTKDGSAVLVNFANDLFYYRIGEPAAVRLTNTPEPERLAQFSPNGQLVAFVRSHNLHVVEVANQQERPLTTAGHADLLHGELDWVYQEEVYGRGRFRAFWWSPDSTRLALLRIDQSPVHKFTVADQIPTRQSIETTRYPKAGDPNSIAALGVVRAAGGAVRWLAPPEYQRQEHLIVHVDWSPDGSQLTYQVQNRTQTWLDLRRATADGADDQRLLREESGGWVNVLDAPRWLNSGDLIWRSERSGYSHLYRLDAKDSSPEPLTSGDWNVKSVLGVDPDEKWIYFLTDRDDSGASFAAEQQAYRVALADDKLERITPRPGNHSVRFDASFRYFIDYSSRIDQPPRVDLYRADGRYLRTITPNLDDRLKYHRLSKPQFVRVPTADGGELRATLIKPVDFDADKKYPVVCYVYSGPQAASVRNRWSGSTYLWHQLLAQRGCAVWICDNRSASGVAKHAWPIRGKLGQFELKDLEQGLVWLKKQHPWVDADRIGIWGWSYGGYMTSYALTHSKSFAAGIAGAPVTDWRNYDTIYTERYMDLPQQNKKGYQTSSVVAAASKLHGRLLLLHGTMDDNVHISNTLQLANALQRSGKSFQLMVYPKNRHSVGQPQQVRHMRELMTEFFQDALSFGDDPG